MIVVDGQYRIAFRVDGEDYDLSSSQLEELIIFESSIDAVPTMKLTLIDDRQKTNVSPIHDGSKIEISLDILTEDEKSEDWMPFRVFKFEIVPQSHSDRIVITGYYDAQDYFKNSQFQAFNSPTFGVASIIADQAGLQSDVDVSDDKQYWVRPGITGYNFLSNTVRHAYKDTSSAYVIGVTRDGVLRFYNIGERRKTLQEPKWKFIELDNQATELEDDEIFYSDGVVASQSGIFNRFQGYGAVGGNFNIEDGTVDLLQVASLDKTSAHLQINKDLLALMKYEYLPFNAGNTHANYNYAKLQNLKILSTFSYGYRVITSSPKDVHLFDFVDVQSKTTDTQEKRIATNGLYFVDRIVTKVTPESLVVCYNLAREGLNSDEVIEDLL